MIFIGMLGNAARLEVTPGVSVLKRLPQQEVITLGLSCRKYMVCRVISVRMSGVMKMSSRYFV